MNAREHPVAGQPSDWSRPGQSFRHLDGSLPDDWRAARPGHPQRRRNQYTPLIDRPWFLAAGFACAVLVLLWQAGVFV